MPAVSGWAGDLAHVETGGAAGWVGVMALLSLAALIGGYGLGVWRLWSRHGLGHGVPVRRAVAFAAGMGVLVGAESPPADAAADASFAAHMAQHMVLLVVAGPLLASGATGLAVAMGAPAAARGWLARLRAAPPLRWSRRPAPLAVTMCLIQCVVLWGWHAPGPYEAALGDDVVHLMEHACFLGASWLLWAPILGAGRHTFSAPVEVAVVFVAGLPAVGLGALLTFAPVALYPDSILAPSGGDPMWEQQLAGSLMWIPMNIAYLVISVVAFLRWLIRYDRRMPSGSELPAPGWAGPETEEVEA